MCDASQEGAQLQVADPNSLPNEVILALSSDGAVRRRCRVIWRTDTSVGVEFLKDAKKESPPARARFMRQIVAGPDADGQDDETSAEVAADKLDIDTLTPR
ncbi:MAG: hypothetical protein EXQ83_17455 [Xanthobacteraceae bacterium]|nr:hypothetical protein [Xanthobacteraceae bacterium]